MFSFGKYEGQSFEQVARDSPFYLLWIAGVKTKYSMKKSSLELYEEICEKHPDDVEAAKAFVQGKCFQCWKPVSPETKHICKGMQPTAHHHYHPYGKRT